MGKAGGFGLLVVGVFLAILGFLIQSDFLAWLLDIIGFIVIIAGVIVGIIGIVKMFSGGDGGSDDF
jgi:predicted tellurium resistance membrane protein TerC